MVIRLVDSPDYVFSIERVVWITWNETTCEWM